VLATVVVRSKQGVHTAQPTAADYRPANVFAVFFDRRRRRRRYSLSHYRATPSTPSTTPYTLPQYPRRRHLLFLAIQKQPPRRRRVEKSIFPSSTAAS